MASVSLSVRGPVIARSLEARRVSNSMLNKTEHPIVIETPQPRLLGAIEEAHVQNHLGHASAEMTRRSQRKRDRFKVNLSKAAGV